MRRKKKTRFLAHIIEFIGYIRPQFDKEGYIYLDAGDVKKFFAFENTDDHYFVKLLRDNLRLLEIDEYRYTCGSLDKGDALYIKKMDKNCGDIDWDILN
jgi:hypothetical protein